MSRFKSNSRASSLLGQLRRPWHRLRAGLIKIVLVFGLVGLTTTSSWAIHSSMGARAEVQQGISMASWWVTGFGGSRAKASLDELAATGANWVAFVVTQYQMNVGTADIGATTSTVNDDDLVELIAHAHDIGLKVMLKPHVDLQDDPTRNRSQIGTTFRSERAWRQWFRAYTSFIEHYARLAADNGVEQLAIGTELASTSHREQQWRAVAEGVRSIFNGTLTYAALEQEALELEWWDAVDLIGVDAYFVLSDSPDPSPTQLQRRWRPYLEMLAELSARWNMPVIFTEIGYTSVAGTTTMPWSWNLQGVVDLQEQALAYDTALRVTSNEHWFAGMFWWYWDPDLRVGGPTDRGFSPSCKPASEVLSEWYGGRGQDTCGD